MIKLTTHSQILCEMNSHGQTCRSVQGDLIILSCDGDKQTVHVRQGREVHLKWFECGKITQSMALLEKNILFQSVVPTHPVQRLKGSKIFSIVLVGRRRVYAVVMATPMCRRLAASETSVSRLCFGPAVTMAACQAIHVHCHLRGYQ